MNKMAKLKNYFEKSAQDKLEALMEDAFDVLALEREFQKLTLDELQHQHAGYRSRIQHLQNEISNLAFNNYRTYADVGRTAEHCKEMFTNVNQYMTQVKRDFPFLIKEVKSFYENSATINKEYAKLDDVNSTNCFIWELVKLPKVMDKCIRAGKYETAYALTNFAINIKQSKLIQNPMVKEVVEILIENRLSLLDELFNKFLGPIDLAKSIQVVNNIRKIPYISNTQLRVSILQYRDVYLEKNVLSIMSEPDFVLQVIEVYRDCMYDTIVLYLAVFPGNTDFQHEYDLSMTADESKWERWTSSSQVYLLQSWAHRNIERLFEFIRSSETKTALDLDTMAGKLMSFAFSFGRMGLDFRPLILHEFSQILIDGFRKKVIDAVKSLVSLKKLDLIDGDIFESTINELDSTSKSDMDILSAPIELCVWDDICVFGNHIIEALNETRHALSVSYVNQMFEILKLALHDMFKWLDGFLLQSDNEDGPKVNTNESKEIVVRAAKLLLQRYVPFMNKCFHNCFSYEKCCRPYFHSYFNIKDYMETFSFLSTDLFLHCKNKNLFIEIFEELKSVSVVLPNNNETVNTSKEVVEEIENLFIVEKAGESQTVEEKMDITESLKTSEQIILIQSD